MNQINHENHKAIAALVGALLLTVPAWAYAQGGLTALLSDKHTVFFLAVNLFLTFYFVVMRFDRFAVVHGPEILTTMGIFGCFFGIALALLDFDPRDVQKSVPLLLEGVKTAFWASVSGVGGSLAIRARHRFQKTPIQATEGAIKSSSLDDVVNAVNGLKGSITGTDEDTLISQIKLMRQDQADHQRQLKASFDDFSEKVVQMSSKALIEALKEVISDFNNKITEQFGENFKRLNEAVGELVVWQQQYKEELDRLQVVQGESAENLRKASDGLAAISDSVKSFSGAAERLVDLSQKLDTQYRDIVASQQVLAQVLGGLKDAVPSFEERIQGFIENINAGVTAVQQELAKAAANYSAQADAHGKQLAMSLQGLANNYSAQAEAHGKQLGQSLQVVAADFSNQSKEAQTRLTEQLAKNLDENLKKVNEGVEKLEKSLDAELNRSLLALGNQLASLSHQFVKDYQPLTEKLKEVVQLSEKVLKQQDQSNGS